MTFGLGWKKKDVEIILSLKLIASFLWGGSSITWTEVLRIQSLTQPVLELMTSRS